MLDEQLISSSDKFRGWRVGEGSVERKQRDTARVGVNEQRGLLTHSPLRSLERGGPLCPLFDLSLQMAQQEIKDERRGPDYCLINRETE